MFRGAGRDQQGGWFLMAGNQVRIDLHRLITVQSKGLGAYVPG